MAVHGGPTNYTLDDTSPTIAYTGTPSLRCAPGICDWSPQLHDGTSTVTDGPITIPFTGSAVYVYLGMGACTFNLDGTYVGDFFGSKGNLSDEIFLAFMNESMPDAPHVLTINLESADWHVQLDYIVYTHDPGESPKSHMGAIIGGVVGGVAAAAIFSVGAVLLRRRQKQKRRAKSDSIPLDNRYHWPDKPSVKLAGLEEQK